MKRPPGDNGSEQAVALTGVGRRSKNGTANREAERAVRPVVKRY